MFDACPVPSAATQRLPIALQQSPPWLAAARVLGSNAAMEDVGVARAMVFRETVPLVGPMALISRADLRLSTQSAATLRDELGVRHLVVNAETAGDAAALRDSGFHKIAAARQIAELRLVPSTDAMAAGLHQKWRNRLRRGQSSGLTLRRRPMPPEPGHWLFRAEARQARQLWYKPVPPQIICAVIAATPGAGHLFTAYHLGTPVAAMLFVRHGIGATYQIGWNNPTGRTLHAGPALMWKAMVDLQTLGVETIDLGAADPAHAPGLARFKRGTGAEVRALGGTWLDTAWAARKGQRWTAAKRAMGRLFPPARTFNAACTHSGTADENRPIATYPAADGHGRAAPTGSPAP